MQDQVVQTVNPNSLATITREEIDVAISTAKRYPREISKFRQDAMSMATIDVETASSCFYKLRREGEGGGKVIEGPSIRLAEIVASAWGNLRFAARIIGEDDGMIIAQGIAHDLETNVSSTMEVRRRITKRDGKRFSPDMVGVTANAACAIAARNALFKVIPFTYAKQIYEAAKRTAVGDAKTLVERRQGMVASFEKMSVTLLQILEYTGKATLEDVGLSEIEDLIGAYNAIKDGDATIDDVFAKKTPLGDRSPAELQEEERKRIKRLRADFTKTTMKCKTVEEFQDACTAFERVHGVDIWSNNTGHNEHETFRGIADIAHGRILHEIGSSSRITEEIVKPWIKNIASCGDLETFAKLEEILSATPLLRDNQERQDELSAKGRELNHPFYSELPIE